MEAPPGQRQNTDARRIQQQRRILRHPSRGDDITYTEVAFIDADQVCELRVIGSKGSAAGQEAVDLSLLVTADNDQVDITAAVVPDLSEHIVDLVLIKSGAGGESAVAGMKDVCGEVLNDPFHGPSDSPASLGIA